MIEKICVSDLQKYFNKIIVKNDKETSKGMENILAAILKDDNYNAIKSIALQNWDVIDFIKNA